MSDKIGEKSFLKKCEASREAYSKPKSESKLERKFNFNFDNWTETKPEKNTLFLKDSNV